MDLVEKKYPIVMKSGTAGTTEDPGRPDVIDALGKLPIGWKWGVNEGEGIVKITCDSRKHESINLIRKEIVKGDLNG